MSLRNRGKNAAKIWHRCKSLIINGLSGRVAVRNLCLKRNRKKRLSYSTRTRLKIQWWMHIWHFWVKSSWALYRGGQERDTTVNIYSHLQNTAQALSWFGAAFQPVMLEILIKLMELRTSDYDPPCNTVVQHENHPKCISNAVKNIRG